MYIRNVWYPLAATSELPDTGRTFTRTIMETPMLAIRTLAGRWTVLEDCCPHRGAPLSEGTLHDDVVTCGFHGLRFNVEGGVCMSDPALPYGRIPSEKFYAWTLPAHLSDEYLWVFMGEERNPTPPEFTIPDEFGYEWGSSVWNCPAEAALGITLDLDHSIQIHPTHPQSRRVASEGRRDRVFVTCVTDYGMIITERDSPLRMGYQIPDRAIVARGLSGFVCVSATPITPVSCRIQWIFASPNLPRNGRWVENEPQIFQQDRRWLEAAGPNYARFHREGRQLEHNREIDRPLLMFREIYKLAAEGLWEEQKDRLIERLPEAIRVLA